MSMLAAGSEPGVKGSRCAGSGIPDRIGPYVPLRLLGGGGQGEVYLAEDPRLQRRVAVKVLRGGDPGRDLQRLRREAELVSRLDHPHICAVYEAGFEGGVAFIVMRYVEGQSLAQRLQATHGDVSGRPVASGGVRNRAAMEEVVTLVEKVARALHHAHGSAIVHRDIKPGNIMITREGEPVVLDFGMASDVECRSGRATLTGEGLGTPAYMSPEQVRGQSELIDGRTDVFSLGAVLYECLTHRRAFGGPTPELVWQAILTREPLDPRRISRHVPNDLVAVLETALSKDASTRYRSAEAFADDLARVRRRDLVLVRRPGPVLRSRRWVQRHRVLAGLLMLLCCVLGIVTMLGIDAVAKGRLSAERLDQLALVSQRARLHDARVEESSLFPAWPERIPALESWLHEYGEPLVAQIPVLRRTLAELEGRPGTPSGRDVTSTYLHRALTALAADLEKFARPGTGDVARIRARLDVARRIGGQTIDAFAERWRETIQGIRASPLYRLDLRPQVGLIPLGRNPATGLYEFYHLRSSAGPTTVPERRGDGGFDVTGTMGLVFVLIPGGEARTGIQGDDPNGPHYEAEPCPWWTLQSVALDPYLISRYEMTQGQWYRLSGGEEPSGLLAEGELGGEAFRMPVETVTALRCEEVLAEFGLALPTSVQWEHAARGGTTSPWYTGSDPRSIEGHENLGGGFPDEHVTTAPVGSYPSNAFGLHDVGGNVSEWCRDEYGPNATRIPRPGDGLRPRSSSPETTCRVVRGGNFSNADVQTSRSSYVGCVKPDSARTGTGLRPVRAVRGGAGF